MEENEKKDVLYIVIPAYNEEENILNIIEEWYPIVEKYTGDGKSRLVILNDGSKDNTSNIVKEKMKNKPLLELVDKQNSGHGATVLYGYQYALDAGADFIFQTDSDGQTKPEEFHEFWDLRYKYDMKLIFGVTVIDANTPFRLMNKESLKECKKLIPDDFNLSNVILSIVYIKKGYKVKYIPITFKPRQGGVNSINLKKIFGIGKKALKDFRTINKNLKREGL